MAAPFTNTNDFATISTSEYSLPGDTSSGVPTSQTTKCKLRTWIDFFALAAGDEYRVRLYEKISAGTQRLVDEWSLIGAQSKLFVMPEVWVDEGWDVTVQKIAGTDRSIRWALKQDVGDKNLVTWLGAAPNALSSGRVESLVGQMANAVITAAKFAAGAIDATAIAGDAITAVKVADDVSTEFANKLLATSLYGSDVAGILRGICDSNAGRVSGFGTGTLLIKSRDGTKTRFTITVDATGRTAVTLGDLT